MKLLYTHFSSIVLALALASCDVVIKTTTVEGDEAPVAEEPSNPEQPQSPEEPQPPAPEEPPDDFAFSALIGANDTRVLASVVDGETEFYRSREPDCNAANYTACDSGQLDLVTAGAVVGDTALTLDSQAWYQVQQGSFIGAAQLQTVRRFAPRHGHAVAEFDGRLWLVGGTTEQGESNELWSTADGQLWQEHTLGSFSARHTHQVVNYRDRLWLFGGDSVGSQLTDIWSSADGRQWQQRGNALPSGFSRQIVSAGEALWLFMSNQADVNQTGAIEIWRSDDGILWQQQFPTVSVSVKRDFRVLYGSGTFWIVGVDANDRSVVWSSSDASDWSQLVADAAFPPRRQPALTFHDGSLWLSGGIDYSGPGTTVLGDIWQSATGAVWQRVRDTAQNGEFVARYAHTLNSFGQRLIAIGGLSGSAVLDGVWSSNDGAVWLAEVPNTPAPPSRIAPQLVSFGGQLLAFGQRFNEQSRTQQRDLSTSDNLLVWQTGDITASMAQRSFAAQAVFDDRLWLVGGRTEVDFPDDVWATEDGFTWSQVTDDVGFDVAVSNNLVNFSNQLWLVGTKGRRDIWSTADGVVWERRQPAGDFPERICYSVSLQNQLWLFGLANINDDSEMAAWFSDDGVNWQRHPALLRQFTFRDQLQVFSDRIWLFLPQDRASDGGVLRLWSFSPEAGWQLQRSELPFPQRTSMRAVVHNEQLVALVPAADGGNALWVSENGRDWRLLYEGSLSFTSESTIGGDD